MLSKIDPKVDFAFKWLFAQERNLPLLTHFLNAVLKPEPGSEIVDLELLNPFSAQDTSDDKLSIVDVKARDLSGRHFDVEMQISNERWFSKRILFYWAELHQKQLKEGEEYSLTRPTISICVLNFSLFPESREYRLLFELCNKEYNIVFSADIKVFTLELPKFTLSPEQISSPLEQWMYFFCNGQEIDSEQVPKELNSPAICKALEELNMLSQDDLERERYLARVRVERDEKSRLISAKEDGIEQGVEIGKAQGKAQGKAEGRAEGMLKIISMLLRHRVGSIDDNLQEQINTLDAEQLEALSEALLNFSSVENLKEWLLTKLG